MFYFVLHPLQWQREEDGDIIFHALRLSTNRYIVSWSTKTGLETSTYSPQEVSEALAKRYWVMTDEYGNF